VKRLSFLNSINRYIIAVYEIISSMRRVDGDLLLLSSPAAVTGGCRMKPGWVRFDTNKMSRRIRGWQACDLLDKRTLWVSKVEVGPRAN